MASAASGTEDYDIWTGHLGHLNEQQQQAFEEFKERLARAGLYSPANPEGGQPSHDDTTLLRFLRARSFNAVKTEEQFAQSEMWRQAHDVDNLYASFEADEMHAARRYYPRWTGRRDRLGLPLFVYAIKHVTPPLVKELNNTPPARRYQQMIALYEFMRLFILRLCSALPSSTFPTPICCTSNIVDLDGVSLSLLWSLRTHLQQSTNMATTNYPETIYRIFIINAPSFFPTVWSWIKGFFDEGTRRKVYILGSDPGAELLKHIDAASLPKIYGGDLDWEFPNDPSVDDEAKAAMGLTEMAEGPLVFVAETLGKGKVVRAGSEEPRKLEPQNDHLTVTVENGGVHIEARDATNLDDSSHD